MTPACSTRTQRYRPMAVSSPLGEDHLLLKRLQTAEQLGRPFEFSLELLSEDWNVDFDAMLGQPMVARLALDDGRHRYFHGLVRAFEQSPQATLGRRLAGYRATLVPWLWFLSRQQNSRIFQKRSARQIILDVFREHGVGDFEDRLVGRYPVRDYCVQYNETDLDFVHRLMEHEGIYYYFEHTAEKHTLVLCDAPAEHEPFDGYARIPYAPDETDRGVRADRITHWQLRRQVEPGVYSTTDFDFKAPRKPLLAIQRDPQDHARAQYEVYDFPGDYTDLNRGEDVARVRHEELAARHELVEAAGDVRGACVGHTFTLHDHPRADQNRAHLVTSSRIDAHQDDYDSVASAGDGQGFHFACAFTAIDAKRPFRPERKTRRPRVGGPQTAIVTGPAGEEIHTDKFGRVKVRFHWDRYGPGDDQSSCWVRVSQAWAGKGWGALQIPRVGQEVIVDFIEGDPDRPIITGRVYNQDHMPPQDLPAAKATSSMKSNTYPGGGGSNEISMDDTKDKQLLSINAQYDEKHNVNHDRTDTVGNDETRHVANNRTRTVGVNEDVTVGADRSTTVKGSETHTVHMTRAKSVMISENEMIGVTKTVQTGLAHVETIGVGHVSLVGVQRFSFTGMNENAIVGVDRTDDVGNDWSMSTGAAANITCGSDFLVQAAANAGVKAGKMLVIECPDITLKAGGNFIRIDGSGVTIVGTKVKINSGGAAGSLSGSDTAAGVAAAGGGSGSGGGGGAGGGGGGGGGCFGGGGGGLFDKLQPLLKAIPPEYLPPGASDALSAIANGQLPSLQSVVASIPPGVLPPNTQAMLNAGAQGLSAVNRAYGPAASAPAGSAPTAGPNVQHLTDPSATAAVDPDAAKREDLAKAVEADASAGRTDYAYDAYKNGNLAERNKCSQYVHDKLEDAGFDPPDRYCGRYDRLTGSPNCGPTVQELADGRMSDGTDLTKRFPKVETPARGDVILFPFGSNGGPGATGHTGIVTDYDPATRKGTYVGAGEHDVHKVPFNPDNSRESRFGDLKPEFRRPTTPKK